MNEQEWMGRIEEKIDNLSDSLTCVNVSLTDTTNRLFKDNGRECIQTKVNRHDDTVKSLVWAVRAVVGAVITAIASVVTYALRGGQ